MYAVHTRDENIFEANLDQWKDIKNRLQNKVGVQVASEGCEFLVKLPVLLWNGNGFSRNKPQSLSQSEYLMNIRWSSYSEVEQIESMMPLIWAASSEKGNIGPSVASRSWIRTKLSFSLKTMNLCVRGSKSTREWGTCFHQHYDDNGGCQDGCWKISYSCFKGYGSIVFVYYC